MDITIGDVVYEYDNSYTITNGVKFSIKSASATGKSESRISALINDAYIERDVDELASEYVDILIKNVVEVDAEFEFSGNRTYKTRRQRPAGPKSSHSIKSGISIVSDNEDVYKLKLFLIYGIYNKSVYEQFKEELFGGGLKQSGLAKRDAKLADKMDDYNEPIIHEMDKALELIFLEVDYDIGQIITSMGDYDDLAQAKSDFQYVQALIRLLYTRHKFYFSSTDKLNVLLSALKKKLNSVPRSSRDIIKIIKRIRKDAISAQSFEKAFSQAFSRIQACRTPTYYSYHDDSGGQGPHTIARVLSVRSNISFMKRCLSDERFSRADFTINSLDAGSLMSSGIEALKIRRLISYVVFTISGIYGVKSQFYDGSKLVMISEATVLQHYRFTVASVSKNAKKTADVAKKYVQDVNMVIQEILMVMLSICRGVSGGNILAKNELVRSLLSDPLALNNIVGQNEDEAGRVREGVNLFAELWSSNWQRENAYYDKRNIFNKIVALVTLIQMLHDMHPCGSAATSAVTDADLSGKGESTLYKGLVGDTCETQVKQNDFMRDFLVKAVDLRFRKKGVDFRLTSADQLLNMSLYDEYFPDALFASHARNYVHSRISAILRLTSVMPEVDSKATALPRRNQLDFSRALSPDRFRRGK